MEPSTEHLDVVIVGAGLSGIGAAYRVSTELPDRSFAVLEARSAVGGTWDLFRYPGVRSDSDMFTLGYPFRPWTDAKAIADGSSILSYIRGTAEDPRIRERIRFDTRLVSASWSSLDARWTLDLEGTDDDGTGHVGTVRRRLTCGFLYLCSGYYDYARGYEPSFPGIGSFEGDVVHPQFWPEGLEYAGKRVVVIGSGATAVTLVPSMAEDAEHVTMLQRSPSYITAVPSRDRFSDAARRLLPAGPAHHVARAKNLLVTQAFYQLCRRRPAIAKKLIRSRTVRILGDENLVDEHFSPAYDPWDQRLCVAPGADFFEALTSGGASVVTDTIDTFTPRGIRLASGRELEADVVVAATGLSMLPLGGATFSVDGRPVDLGNSWVYRGLMISGVPNLALCVGYTNASWTLRADLSSRYVCRLLHHMDRHGHRYGTPSVHGTMTARPILDLASGYVQRAVSAFPKQGDRRPWTLRQNYLLDAATALHGNLAKDMVFDVPVPPTDTPVPDLQESHA